MANDEHVERLQQGMGKWNQWRKDVDTSPDLCGADLSGTDLSYADLRCANLSGANLSSTDPTFFGLFSTELHHADLRGAVLRGANLCDANLRSANLRGADLRDANLRGADLRDADLGAANVSDPAFGGCRNRLPDYECVSTSLVGANLRDADLCNANLQDANLFGANLHGTNFHGANLSGAICGGSAFTDVDLSKPLGLEKVAHRGPSSISTDTLIKTAESLTTGRADQGRVEVFLRGAGVKEDILEFFRTVMIGSPIEFYSCFISYTQTDKVFARRIYDTLQGRGIRCWLDEKELCPGDHLLDEIDRGIRLWDKIIIVCSEASLGFSPWVNTETGLAIEKEKRLGKQAGKPVRVLIPLNLDGYLFSEHCAGGNVAVLRSRLAADFTNWEKDNAKFEKEFEKVVKALRTDERPELAGRLAKVE